MREPSEKPEPAVSSEPPEQLVPVETTLPSGVRKPLELSPSLSRQSLRSLSASKKERS